MATDALTQAIIQGLDPGVYQPLSNIRQGEALQAVGQDASPTSKWGALGRLANAAAGTYLSNSGTSDLAKTLAAGKRSLYDDVLKTLSANQGVTAPVPMAAPAQAAPPTAPLQPSVQPSVPAAAGSPNAQVANRFPADWSPGTAASPLPNDAPSPLDTAQSPAGPVPPATAVAANAPRGVRNNNPLNIEAGDFTKSQPGFSGSDGRFAKFDTPQNGLAAAHALLDVYDTKHGLNTVNGIVGRWAPGTDGNNVSAYASDVAQRLGIDPNAPIPKEMRPALVAAMAQHENGVPVPGADQAPYKVAGPATAAPRAAAPAADDDETPAAAAASNAGRLDINKLLSLRSNPYADENLKGLIDKLVLQELTPKEHEFASSPQGIFDKTTGELKKGTGTGVTDFGGLQGKDLMTAVQQQNPAMASQVTAIIEGRAPYPTGSRLNPVQQQIKELVTQIDPTFEAGNSGARVKVRNEFNAGGPNSPASAITAGNTAIQHLGHLSDEAEKLGNADSGIPGNNLYNTAKNAIAVSSGSGVPVTNFDSIRNKYIEEATKFYRGTGGNESDLQRDIASLNSAQSPSQLRDVIKTQSELMQSKINALQERWHQGMGPLVPEFPIIHPESQSAIDRINQRQLGKKVEGEAPAATSADAPAVPDRAAIEAEMRKRGLLQ